MPTVNGSFMGEVCKEGRDKLDLHYCSFVCLVSFLFADTIVRAQTWLGAQCYHFLCSTWETIQ